MAGTVVADTLQSSITGTPPQFNDGVGTQIGTLCRAWVNFNGTTVTNPASMTGVRGSFNVSSILDNGAGDYTVNFTTAMPDVNYSCVGSTGLIGSGARILSLTTAFAAGSVRIGTFATSTAVDLDNICIAIFR